MSLRSKIEEQKSRRAQDRAREEARQVQENAQKTDTALTEEILSYAEPLSKVSAFRSSLENDLSTVNQGGTSLREKRQVLREIYEDSKDETTGEPSIPKPHEILKNKDHVSAYAKEPEVAEYNQSRDQLKGSLQKRDALLVEIKKEIEGTEGKSPQEILEHLGALEGELREKIGKFSKTNPQFIENKITRLETSANSLKEHLKEQEKEYKQAVLEGEHAERRLEDNRGHLLLLNRFLSEIQNFSPEIKKMEEEIAKRSRSQHTRDQYKPANSLIYRTNYIGADPQTQTEHDNRHAEWEEVAARRDELKREIEKEQYRAIKFDPFGLKEKARKLKVESLKTEYEEVKREADDKYEKYREAFDARVKREADFQKLFEGWILGSVIDDMVAKGKRNLKEAVNERIAQINEQDSEFREAVEHSTWFQQNRSASEKTLEKLEKSLEVLKALSPSPKAAE